MRRISLSILVCLLIAGGAGAQGLFGDPVFSLSLQPDREPLVAGEPYRLALVLEIDEGWHVNTDAPGDEFAVPTTVAWNLPHGWAEPALAFPAGRPVQLSDADMSLSVWDGRVVLTAAGVVPPGAEGAARIAATVTAQACDDRNCLPPVDVTAAAELDVAPAGTESTPVNAALFPRSGGETETLQGATGAVSEEVEPAAGGLADRSFLIQLLLVFLAGLALNLTPCVYPLIPITVGFFARQSENRTSGTFGLALMYVLGIAATYSVLGVVAALTGQLFGAALQNPWVIGVLVVVLIALALSMFGVWELKVPNWAMRASGGRGGFLGALLMGLLVGVVAAPCVGPFVLGLLTYVGQRQDPALGFALFFALSIGLGLPYLVLGTFTGALNRLPASGRWMIGIRKVFGVILLGLAVYFAAPLLPAAAAAWLMSLVLGLGGLYLLVVDRSGHETPAVDRVMRLLTAALVAVAVWLAPIHGGRPAEAELDWPAYDEAAVEAAVASGAPVILDFSADWCLPCRELEEKTFTDPHVAAALADYHRFKIDLTTSTPAGTELRRRYDVRGVPTLILFRDGAEVARVTGFEPPEAFLDRLR